jgi:hypothetical protein
MMKFLLGIMVSVVLAVQAMAANPVTLKADHPDEYVVQRGDTLWDISGRFLEKPWLWPEIWQVNPQIANPHLIYPGDRLSLIYVDGRPRLALNRGSGGVVKLSPEVHSSPLDDAIPAIPLEEINAFLTRSRIVEGGEMEAAPYVLSGAGAHVVSGAGDNLYARGGNFPPGERSFGIFRAGQVFVDPVTGEVLGKEALEIGAGKLTDLEAGVGTLAVNKSNEEIRAGDRLLPVVEQKITATFFPSAPESQISGIIMAVEGGVTQIGHLDVVAVNRGAREGLKDGNVLEISKRGEMVVDPVTGERVRLPSTRAGMLMVFRTFEKMSYGLVLHATQPLAVMDTVANP